MSDWIKTHSEMDRAFEQNQVLSAPEADLQRWLQNLCTGHIPNETVRHREIIRGLTINHIQMDRTIKGLERTMTALNAANDETQRQIGLLTKVAVVLGIIQTCTAVLAFLK